MPYERQGSAMPGGIPTASVGRISFDRSCVAASAGLALLAVEDRSRTTIVASPSNTPNPITMASSLIPGLILIPRKTSRPRLISQ